MPNPTADARSAENTGQEGLRRPTVVPPPVAANPEVSERPHRRTICAQEKPSILKAADRATGACAIGAILRRHGLYSSALSEWRRQRDAGTRGALTPARRGPKPSEANPLTAELAGALWENAQLNAAWRKADGPIVRAETMDDRGKVKVIVKHNEGPGIVHARLTEWGSAL
jgi:transposase